LAGFEVSIYGRFSDVHRGNEAIAKAGCPECIYHLWKASGTENGRYNYIMISHWSGSAMYLKVHNDPGYATASGMFLALRSVVQEEVYNRFEEVSPATR
jgi:hypothetical protein